MSEINAIATNNYLLSTQQEVSHDNTLSGNGTVDSPLGVVPGYNETVLWEGTYNTNTVSLILSEAMTNFKSIKVLWQHNNDSNARRMWFEYDTGTIELFSSLGRADSDSERILFEAWWSVASDKVTLTKKFCRWNYMTNGNAATSWTAANELVPIKIVGINRIANN